MWPFVKHEQTSTFHRIAHTDGRTPLEGRNSMELPAALAVQHRRPVGRNSDSLQSLSTACVVDRGPP